jgi:histone-lysine N-methyltransferase SETMAR
MLLTFLDIKGIVHFQFITQVQTFNHAYYVEILKQLHEAVHRKRPELWPNYWTLHYEHVPANKALSVKHFLAEKSITEIEHPPYYPDLAPYDFWLFPERKSVL